MEFEEFEEWLFLVDRDVDWELDEIRWAEGDQRVASWLVEILANWASKAKSLSHKAQNTILWRIGSNPIFIRFMLFDDSKLEFDEKVQILSASKLMTLSIPSLFAPGEPMETGYYMWWDSLASNIKSEELGTECLRILEELVMHADERVQLAALHGLGHLDHPGRASAVDLFLQFHPDLAGDRWILECRDGTVM